MINLAGNKDADKYVKEELCVAGIDQIDSKSKGEVPYTIIGKLGKWNFRRASYYWVATTERREDGLPLGKAMELHNLNHPIKANMGKVIRSGGHCGCPAPDEYGAFPVYDDLLIEKLRKLGYNDGATRGEIKELFNKGKLTGERYVDCYHIDDQIGLNQFAKFIMDYHAVSSKG